jgi:hypothetical protein
MNRTTRHAVAASVSAALLLALGATLVVAADRPVTKPSYRDKYGPIAEHNIFLKDRRKPASRPDRGSGYGSGAQPERVPEASFILTGVVIEEGQLRAYVEDSNAGKGLRLSVGDAVARGHIADIEIDAVAYAGPGQPIWVSLGCDFRGNPVASMSPARSGSYGSSAAPTTTSPSAGTGTGTGAAATPAPATPAGPVDPSNMSIEDKMRARRAQELQK